MCALKQLISPVNMFFYSDVRIWLEGAAVATAPFLCCDYRVCDINYHRSEIKRDLQKDDD